MSTKKIDNYKDFWPFYLKEHRKPATRTWHFYGSSIAFVFLVSFIATLNPWFLLAGLLSGYGFAWFSHFNIEKNRPATFTYPFWSFFSDWRMWYMTITGQLKQELQKYDI
jgi:hypothetical protein